MDGGLCSFCWRLEEEHEWRVYNSLPKGDGGPEVSAELSPDDSRMEAVGCYSGTCKIIIIKKKNVPHVYGVM